MAVKFQPDRRRDVVFTDKTHNRRFACTVEKETNHPVGSLNPVGHKEHPFFPLNLKFVVFSKENDLTFTIDYDSWEAEVVEANKQWEDRVRNLAAQMSPEDAGANLYANRTPALMKLAGNPPLPVDFVRASRAGNKWILGLKKPDGEYYPTPQWAEKYLVKEVEIQNEYPDLYEDLEEDAMPAGVASIAPGSYETQEDRYSDLETPAPTRQRKTRMGKEQ